MTYILAASSGAAAMSGEGVYNYGLIIFLMMTGLYLVLAKGNMIKSVIGLNIFQVSVIMFYVSMGRVEHGTAPILLEKDIPHHDIEHDEGQNEEHGRLQSVSSLALVSTTGDGHSTASSTDVDTHKSVHSVSNETAYSNPLPHVLMLTAIVVGVATTALALSLVVRIREFYNTIEEDYIDELEKQMLQKESQS